MNKSPVTDCFWLVPGKLMAGEYPGATTKDEARHKLRSFLDAGVGFFLDLTEENEGLEPYAPLLQEEAIARKRTVIHKRIAIPGMGVPTTERMREIQQAINRALDAGHTVYVHGWGGVGRTEMVIGCFLVEQEVSGAEALAEIRRLRRITSSPRRIATDSKAQEDFVKSWRLFTSQ